MDTRPYYTVSEAAKRLAVSPSTIWRWIESDKLPAYRVGPRTIRIKREDLEGLVKPVHAEQRAALTEPAPIADEATWKEHVAAWRALMLIEPTPEELERRREVVD